MQCSCSRSTRLLDLSDLGLHLANLLVFAGGPIQACRKLLATQLLAACSLKIFILLLPHKLLGQGVVSKPHHTLCVALCCRVWLPTGCSHRGSPTHWRRAPFASSSPQKREIQDDNINSIQFNSIQFNSDSECNMSCSGCRDTLPISPRT